MGLEGSPPSGGAASLMQPGAHADISAMKSKVSPRLLIPLGVALLLLVAFAATRVLGGDDEPTAGETTELAGTTDATAGEDAGTGGDDQVAAADSDDPPVDGTPVGADDADESTEWVAEANEICGRIAIETSELAAEASPDGSGEALSEALAASRDALDELRALTPEPGTEAEVDEFLDLLEASFSAAEELASSFESGDTDRFAELLGEQALNAARAQELGESLGADACVGGTEDGDVGPEPELVTAALETVPGSKGLVRILDALQLNESVVVVVYSPSAELDNKVLREARAAADESGAGFVAVNGTKEAQVRVLADQLGLRETPATLVVQSGPVVSNQFTGFADRETVVQAVTNASQAS